MMEHTNALEKAVSAGTSYWDCFKRTDLRRTEIVCIVWAIATGSLLLAYTFTYEATVGPVCYSLVAELSSTRLRAKSIILARNLYNVVGLVTTTITPRMLNPTAWNGGAKAGFFWASSCFLCFIWSYFRLPEAKGRTYSELDVLFERGVSARRFKSTIVDLFLSTHIRRESIAAIEEKGEKTTVEYVEGSHMVT